MSDQAKQEKLKNIVRHISDLKSKKEELAKYKKRKQLVVSAIKATFFAGFLWYRLGDGFSLGDDDMSSEADDGDILLEDDLVLDEAFEGLFTAFEDLDVGDVDVFVCNFDLSDLSMFELEAAEEELSLLLINLS
jgi:hypothetical protein